MTFCNPFQKVKVIETTFDNRFQGSGVGGTRRAVRGRYGGQMALSPARTWFVWGAIIETHQDYQVIRRGWIIQDYQVMRRP